VRDIRNGSGKHRLILAEYTRTSPVFSVVEFLQHSIKAGRGKDISRVYQSIQIFC
jgi:hypothetical protein